MFFLQRLTSSYSLHAKLGQYWSGEETSPSCADGRRAESCKAETKGFLLMRDLMAYQDDEVSLKEFLIFSDHHHLSFTLLL